MVRAVSRGRPIVDLAGRRFGKLYVKELEETSPAKWICGCDCGNETAVFARNLVSGNTKSCGSNGCRFENRIKDLTGQRFGTLVVVRMHSRRRVKWLCRCDCGDEKAVWSTSLIRGDTRSCGKRECRRKGRHAGND